MLIFGPTSSIFDVTTFLPMWCIKANSLARHTLFQSGGFKAGLLTQPLVAYFADVSNAFSPKLPGPGAYIGGHSHRDHLFDLGPTSQKRLCQALRLAIKYGGAIV